MVPRMPHHERRASASQVELLLLGSAPVGDSVLVACYCANPKKLVPCCGRCKPCHEWLEKHPLIHRLTCENHERRARQSREGREAEARKVQQEAGDLQPLRKASASKKRKKAVGRRSPKRLPVRR